MKTVVFTATPFCFGPVSKMLAISEAISDARKIFIGTGVALDLAKIHSFDEIYEVSPSNREEILSLLRRVELLVNVMDFELNHLAKSAECPYFLIDSLLWFWPFRPEGVENADIYFCQNFFTPVAQKIEEYQLTNAKLIGPIVSNNFSRHKMKDQAIINFGGLENPFVQIGENSQYPFVILKNLLPILKQSFLKILVTGRERVMEMCRAVFPEDDSLTLNMLDQRTMLEELYSSAALFTTPGIQTFYDAADKLPIFCLPPHNSSNVRNLDILVSQGIIKHYLKWDELYEFSRERADEGEEVEQVLAKVRLFETRPDDQKVLQEKVEKFLLAEHTWPDLVKIQKQALEQLGKNGREEIIRWVNEVLSLKASAVS